MCNHHGDTVYASPLLVNAGEYCERFSGGGSHAHCEHCEMFTIHMHNADTQTRCLSRYPTPAKVFNKERGSQSQDVHQAMMLLHDDHDGEHLGDVYHYQDCHGKPFPS